MSSMKKNVLAVALVAGLGLAGAAAAYNYGTDPARSTPENVAYQMLFAASYNYTMTEAIVFDIDPGDNAVNFTQGFTVRVKLNRTCPGGPFQTAGVPDPSTCTDTFGAKFATTNAGLLYTAKGTAALLVPVANYMQQSSGTWDTVFIVAAGANILASVLAIAVLKPWRKVVVAKSQMAA